MKQLVLLFLMSFFMLSTIAVSAQQKPASSLEWNNAGVLPAFNGHGTAIGVAGPVVGVHQNRLLVAGGANFPDGMPWLGGTKKYWSDGFVFQISPSNKLELLSSFTLPKALGYAAICTTPNGVVAAGGENEGGLQKEVLLLQWNDATQTVTTAYLPSLPFAAANASMAYHQNKFYVAGGERASDVSNELWVLDWADTAAGWRRGPALPKPVSHAVMVVQSNGKSDCLYLVGGRKRNPGSTSDLYASVFQFNFKKGNWIEKKPLPYALSAGTGIPVGTNAILLFGGDGGETFHKAEALIAAISKEPDVAKKQLLTDEKTAVQASHPGFCRQVLVYDTKKNRWASHSCLPFPTPVTTTAVSWQGSVFIPSGEIKAGVRTPEIRQANITAF